jgi:uncharacterized protein involved in outer membrane biogenesis
MSRSRKYSVIAVVVLVVLVAVQAGTSFIVRTRRVRGFLTARLESAFGRPVQVDGFSIQLLPVPELDMDRVTIGEDPAFGREYFLRADRMTAGFRWVGLLSGRFQFGTISLTRPSLILVRNADGRWNLEGWLPPARSRASAGGGGAAVPQKAAESTHHLQTIEFEDGRINFKTGNEKRPFAFINVSGRVEQVSPGRWRLRLEADPWRSGVILQSTGTLYVAGDVAGTSARLQPAQIQVHWEKGSLADLFRLVTGNDSGVRGEFALDGNTSVGMTPPAENNGASDWRFQVQARATEIHRWDLTERNDNPRINVNIKGVWNPARDQTRAEELQVELPHSNLNGTAVLQTSSPNAWRAQFRSMSVEAEDLLAWYRAFQVGMSDQVTVNDSLRGNLSLSGWPLRWEEGTIETKGSTLQVPGLRESRIEAFRGGVDSGKFSVDGLRLKLGADVDAPAAKAHAATVLEDSLEFNLNHDSVARQGSLRMNVRLANTERVFKLTSVLGRRLDQGWEYSGGANGSFLWNWQGNLKDARRSGSVELTKARLAIVGLNQPLKIEESRLEWRDGRRTATIGKVEGFGANWSGVISEVEPAVPGGAGSNWSFQLHADRLDATDLDLWFGPRSRPNWVQRLMTSLLGETAASSKASELLRRVTAQGELTADALSVEKVKLTKAHANVRFHNLQLQVTSANAQWAGGNVAGQITAAFSPVPHYEVTAEVERANLAELPWASRWAERWGGTASGTIQLTTGGVGRAELLKQLSGGGDVRLNNIELRGWDVRASAELGVARTGTSRWTSGEGKFEIGDQEVRFDRIQLDGPQAHTQLTGTLGFDMSGEVNFLPGTASKRGTKIAQASRGFSLTGPLETPKAVILPVSGETTRP